MANQTKYYYIDFSIDNNLEEINPEEITGFVKDGKATDNWIFVQIDGSIKCAFGKYNIPYPKYVLVNRDWKTIGEMHLTIVRDDTKNELVDALYWNVSKPFIQDELDHQARANSDEENGIIYNFKII